METALIEFQSHLEEVAKKAGKEAAKTFLSEYTEAREKSNEKRKLVSVRELSEITGLSIATLIRHRDRGLIEGFRIGGRVFYDPDQVLREMKSTRR